MKYIKSFYESKQTNFLKDKLFNVVSDRLSYNIKRLGKGYKRKLIPDIPEKLLPYIERLLELEKLSEDSEKLLTHEYIKSIIFWMLMEIKFEDDFKNSKKDFIKYIIVDMDIIKDNDDLLVRINNVWFHHNHPIATATYFADSIPPVSEFLKKYGL